MHHSARYEDHDERTTEEVYLERRRRVQDKSLSPSYILHLLSLAIGHAARLIAYISHEVDSGYGRQETDPTSHLISSHLSDCLSCPLTGLLIAEQLYSVPRFPTPPGPLRVPHVPQAHV